MASLPIKRSTEGGGHTQVRLVTWNIGLRGLKNTVKTCGPMKAIIAELKADILCLQEIKCTRAELTEDMALVDGFSSYFSFPRKGVGYAGTATFVADKLAPKDAREGVTGVLDRDSDGASRADAAVSEASDAADTDVVYTPLQLDSEGRCVVTDHGSFVLFNVYFPASACGKRTNFKMQFHNALLSRAKELIASGREVVVTGDVNIIHKSRDTANPKEMEDYMGCKVEEGRYSQWLSGMIAGPDAGPDGDPDGADFAKECGDAGESKRSETGTRKPQFVDAFRAFFPERPNAYTHWNSVTSARETNYGSRLDYVLSTKRFHDRHVTHCDIQPEFMGSDHCPVFAELTVPRTAVKVPDELPSTASCFFPELSVRQQKLSSFFVNRSQATPPQETPTTRDSHASSHSLSSRRGVASSITRFITSKPVPSKPVSSKPVSSKPVSSKSTKRPSVTLNMHSFFGGKPCSTTPAATTTSAGSVSSPTKRGVLPPKRSETSTKTSPTKKSPFHAGAVVTPGMPPLTHRPASGKAASSAWKTLLQGPAAPPVCRHGEPSVERMVLKDGINAGKRFYVCARPEGLKSDPKSRCNFFRWMHVHLEMIGRRPGGQPKKRPIGAVPSVSSDRNSTRPRVS